MWHALCVATKSRMYTPADLDRRLHDLSLALSTTSLVVQLSLGRRLYIYTYILTSIRLCKRLEYALLEIQLTSASNCKAEARNMNSHIMTSPYSPRRRNLYAEEGVLRRRWYVKSTEKARSRRGGGARMSWQRCENIVAATRRLLAAGDGSPS